MQQPPSVRPVLDWTQTFASLDAEVDAARARYLASAPAEAPAVIARTEPYRSPFTRRAIAAALPAKDLGR